MWRSVGPDAAQVRSGLPKKCARWGPSRRIAVSADVTFRRSKCRGNGGGGHPRAWAESTSSSTTPASPRRDRCSIPPEDEWLRIIDVNIKGIVSLHSERWRR